MTIAYNSTNNGHGGGAYEGGTGRFVLRSSIIANNTATNSAAHDCHGLFDAPGQRSIVEVISLTCQFTTPPLYVTDPQIQLLGAYGGPTPTHALLLGSPAIDNGHRSDCLPDDQRHYLRDGLCDIGAYEFNAGTPTAIGLASLNLQTEAKGWLPVTLLLIAVTLTLASGVTLRKSKQTKRTWPKTW